MHVVLYVDRFCGFGGVEWYALDLTIGLLSLGHTVTCAAAVEGPIGAHFTNLGVPFHVAASLEDLCGLIGTLRPGIVDCQVSRFQNMGYLAATTVGVPVVLTQHHPSGYSSANPQTPHEIVNCEFVNRLRPGARLVHPSFTPKRFEITIPRDVQRDTLSIPHDANVIGRVGRLTAAKAIEDYLLAVADLPGTWGLIGGGGPAEAELRLLASDLGCLNRTAFTGASPHHFQGNFFNAMDVIAYPTYDEGLCFGVVEPLLMSKPVVAYPTGGIPENVVDHQTGRLALDESGLVTAASHLLDDAEFGKACGAAGYARVTNKGYLDSTRNATEHLRCYSDAILSSPARKTTPAPIGEFATEVRPDFTNPELLAHPDPNVRWMAAYAIGATGDRSSLLELGPSLFSEDENLQILVAKALARLPEADAAHVVSARIGSATAKVRKHLILALGEVGGRQAMDTLVHLIDHDDWVCRCMVAVSLGRLGVKAVADNLDELKYDHHAAVRSAAEQAQRKLRG